MDSYDKLIEELRQDQVAYWKYEIEELEMKIARRKQKIENVNNIKGITHHAFDHNSLRDYGDQKRIYDAISELLKKCILQGVYLCIQITSYPFTVNMAKNVLSGT